MRNPLLYRLEGRVPVPELCVDCWGEWMQTANRRVALSRKKEIVVSTIFLAVDHGWLKGSPILWETMIFGGPFNGRIERCSGSWEDAQRMHERILNLSESGQEWITEWVEFKAAPNPALEP